MVIDILFFLELSLSHSGFDSLAWPSSRSWRCRAGLVHPGLLGSCCPHCQCLSQPSGCSWFSPSLLQPRTAFGRDRQLSAAFEGCLCTASLLGTFLAGTRSMKQGNWIQSISCGAAALWATAFIGAEGPLLALFLALQNATKPGHCQRMSWEQLFLQEARPPLPLPYSGGSLCMGLSLSEPALRASPFPPPPQCALKLRIPTFAAPSPFCTKLLV